MNKLIEIAQFWTKKGIAVLPVQYKDKRPDINSWAEYQKRLPTDTEIVRWFTNPRKNLGVITGWKNLVILDFDDMETYRKWMFWCIRQGKLKKEIAQNNYRVKSARGYHVYLYLLHPEKNRKLPGLDIKATGGYVLAPPSIHPSGVEYKSQSGIINQISDLSKILPADLLLQTTTPIATNVKIPDFGKINVPAQSSDDPWELIMNYGDPDNDLILKIRSKFKIEEFFPDAKMTSLDGRWLMTNCPFHDDKNPSFWIDTKNQICGCYGGCTYKPLDVINLYARLYGLDNTSAILVLAKRL